MNTQQISFHSILFHTRTHKVPLNPNIIARIFLVVVVCQKSLSMKKIFVCLSPAFLFLLLYYIVWNKVSREKNSIHAINYPIVIYYLHCFCECMCRQLKRIYKINFYCPKGNAAAAAQPSQKKTEKDTKNKTKPMKTKKKSQKWWRRSRGKERGRRCKCVVHIRSFHIFDRKYA